MRVMLVSLAGLGALLAAAPEAQAHDYPWCVASTVDVPQDCAYTTKAQCDATASGYSYCIRNYAIPDYPPAPQSRRARRMAP